MHASPCHAFEVQVRGDFFKALTKLKHAWDMWNCRPYLVITDMYMTKAKQLIQGSLHEMGKVLEIINYRKIRELYIARKTVDELEGEIGLAL